MKKSVFYKTWPIQFNSYYFNRHEVNRYQSPPQMILLIVSWTINLQKDNTMRDIWSPGEKRLVRL